MNRAADGAPTGACIVQPAGSQASRAGDVTVVIDDLHVSYRVLGARRRRRSGWDWLPRPRRSGATVREVRAIRGISLVARRGDAIGVVGKNGSGKTTLLRAIAGLVPPERGQVYVGDQAPALLGVSAGLMSDLSGERNTVISCLAMGVPRRAVRSKYRQITEFAGLEGFMGLPMRTYSTGMTQRLRFAIATATQHDVVLIDEALATGDAEFRMRSAERLAELRAQASTVFLVSHTLDPILETCNRAIWLEGGRLRADADPATVCAAYLGAGLSRDSARQRLASRRAVSRRQRDHPVDGRHYQQETPERQVSRSRVRAVRSAPVSGGGTLS